MAVAVVVPFRSGCPYRKAAWEWVRSRYVESHPGWQLIEAQAPSGEWCKATAINPAVESCDAEIIVQGDADVWTDGLRAAVDAVAAGAPWAIPHLKVHRLSEEGTATVLMAESWRGQPLAQRPYRGVAGGGFVVASRPVLEAVPLDPRYRSWGQEDESHAMALSTLVGPPWRGDADLVHLFHPPQERMTRRRGSRESWDLRKRYFRARNDPAAMAALIEESREPSPTSQYASDHPAEVG